jgi:excisionase family DNA binding protein
MAGMFYSLQEAAKKLGKSEDEVRKLAASNKLRLFRDGSNLLFKIDEVNALAAEALDGDLGLDLEPAEPGTDIFASPDAADAKEPTEEDLLLDLGEDTPVAELEIEPAAEPTGEEPTAEMDAEALDLELEPSSEPILKEENSADEADASSELGLAPEEDQLAAAASDADLLAGLTEDETAAPAAELPTEAAEEDEISLTSESSALGAGSDITDMDTALTGQGINVLGDSSAGDKTSGDSSAETAAPAGEGTEASLEEIEDDVNLDSFGSGSGLLDLSLQADDTSLGGILDEIYTSEGGGEEGKAAASPASVEDISAEADHVTADTTELVSSPEAMMPMAAVAAASFMEVPPDRASNLLGGLLVVPLVALLYAAIVAWAGLKNAELSIVEPIKGMIWYVVGGLILVTAIVAAIAFTSGREAKPRAPKAAKAVKEKPAKKDKAAKKAEAAEEAEPAAKGAKPKKSFLSFSLGKKKK